MSLTKKQVQILESMKLNEWVHRCDLPSHIQGGSLISLFKKKKCEAVVLTRPNTITDADIEKGTVTFSLHFYSVGEPRGFSFIRKITDDYRTDEDNAIVILQEKVRILEKQLITKGGN